MTEINIPVPELHVKQNGVNKPKADSLMGYVWAVADALMAWRTSQSFEHAIPTSKEVSGAVLSKLPDTKAQMISLAFSKWIKFHNLETMRGARALDERKSAPGIKSLTAEQLTERYSRYAMREVKARGKYEKARNDLVKLADAFKDRGLEVPAITAPEAAAPAPKAEKAAKKAA